MKQDILLVLDTSQFNDIKLYDKAFNIVSDYRKKKINNINNINDKYLSLGCEILLKYGLKTINREIDLNKIDYNNKPKIDDSIYFNFSHSGDYTICAISENEVGCDIQKIGNLNLDIAKNYFNINEYDFLMSIGNEDLQKDSFYRMWCIKESFLKNIGTGLKKPLKSIEVDIKDDITIKQNIDDKKYFFKEYEIKDYICYVCSLNNNELKIINADLEDILSY